MMIQAKFNLHFKLFEDTFVRIKICVNICGSSWQHCVHRLLFAKYECFAYVAFFVASI